jgi:hypothetical protein
MHGNVRKAHNKPEPERVIADMVKGEVGYTLPWAYDEATNSLNLNYPVYHTPKGTAALYVKCVGVQIYDISFPFRHEADEPRQQRQSNWLKILFDFE